MKRHILLFYYRFKTLKITYFKFPRTKKCQTRLNKRQVWHFL